MNDALEPCDALGNPIVLGTLYGTISSYDGKHSTVLGTAENFTKSGNITLRITCRMNMERGIMIDRTNESYYGSKAKTTISPHPAFIFPVGRS